MKRFLSTVMVVSMPMLLTGCLGDIMEIFCEVGPDEDHCYQAAAVQESEPANCEKIAGEGFSGSNPPKDKCFLQIAKNTGDPSVCTSIEGGFMSYSVEECVAGALASGTPEGCDEVENPEACRTAFANNGRGCGEGFIFIGGKCEEVQADASSSSIEGSDDDIDSAIVGDLSTIKDAATGKYMELLDADIEDETDPGRLAGLQAYKDFLEKAGENIETAQATLEQLQELKKIFIDTYDPAMDIQHMPVEKILEKGLFERMKERLLGGGDPLTGLEAENADAEDALTVYEAMLKRQEDNDFLKKGKLERLGDTVSSKFKDDVTGRVKDSAEEIATGIAGTAFVTVGIVGDALQSFQDEAQKQMFLGLARAYNRRRDALEQQHPNLSPEELHKLAVEQVKDDPYQDNTQLAVVKHGNILENKDCADDSNPLCISGDVFWTAMDKTYLHNKK